MGKLVKMEPIDKDFTRQNPRPTCFGDEVKFVTYMEDQAVDSECARCTSENDCGEFILLKCSK